MAKKLVKIMNMAFRDGFQSVYGARVFSKDFMPAVDAAYKAGMRWFEAGGGARFQSCYFYCQEDAFDVGSGPVSLRYRAIGTVRPHRFVVVSRDDEEDRMTVVVNAVGTAKIVDGEDE